jgi:hypothetical protein
MTAQKLMDILDRNDQQGILLVRDNGSVYEIIHLEEHHYDEGTYLRFWFFNDSGKLTDTCCRPAPNGEMDLLAEYADDLDTYGHNGEMPYRVVWC